VVHVYRRGGSTDEVAFNAQLDRDLQRVNGHGGGCLRRVGCYPVSREADGVIRG
jgi:hypothetical protein